MSRRTDAIRRIAGWLTRGGLVALWALVGWGTLLLLATAAAAFRDGPGTALGRLLPGSESGPWGVLNAIAAALAVAAWLILAGLLAQSRWGTRLEPEAGGSSPAEPAAKSETDDASGS
jgi:hypothetical protein